MTFDEYVRAVEDGDYPDDPRVPDSPIVSNKNGRIHNVAFGQFGGMAIIYSNAESVRSNHYHKTDWHYIVVLSGIIQYCWRPANSKKTPNMWIFEAGKTFFTPPMVEHAVVSAGPTQIASLSKHARRHEEHEADLVRIKMIELDVNGKMMIRP